MTYTVTFRHVPKQHLAWLLAKGRKAAKRWGIIVEFERET